MKKILYFGFSLVMLAVTPLSLTSCIDETEPTDGATQEQVEQSDQALEANLLGLNNQFIKIWNSSRHWTFGYGAMMIVRNIQSGEALFSANGDNYDQFWTWSWDRYGSRDYLYGQFLWNYQNGFVMAANNVIALTDTINGSDEIKGIAAAAIAFRSLIYLDMAREYEFLENDKTEAKSPEGMDISGLTVPIVTEKTTEEESRNNPRVTRETMFKFLEKDLHAAARLITGFENQSKTMPHLDCVYGLLARLYMWVEDYPNAEKYARLAIDASESQPITEDDALNIQMGGNDINQWMWGAQYSDGDVHNLINWASFMTAENMYGYSGPLALGGAGCLPQIDAAHYARLSNTDWRKKEFIAPSNRHPLYGQTPLIDKGFLPYLEPYTSVKFRPNLGKYDDYTKGNVTAYPIMRVEEMYFIEAEAAAHQDVSRGKQLLANFMALRDPNYTCSATSTDDVVEEIVFQKMIELWGEGQTFFDIKRLDLPVTKKYSGSNWISNAQFNTPRRPAWMNWAIVKTEENNNTAVKNYNNPDPSGHY